MIYIDNPDDTINHYLFLQQLLYANYTHKNKDLVTPTPLKTRVNSAAPEG
jgi:hypothetical protein